MGQTKRPLGRHTGRPSTNPNSSPQSFAFFDQLKQSVLGAARIEVHAERAGFRRGRGGRWHSAFREDRNPSCSIRNGCVTDWGRNERWNAIDLEMLATGGQFLPTLRAMAGEYGLRWPSPVDSLFAVAVVETRRNLQEAQTRAFAWRTGFLQAADEILEEEKAKLFTSDSEPADESLILSLSRAERTIRKAEGGGRLVATFNAVSQSMPELTETLIRFGERLRMERQTALMKLINLMATAEDRC